MDDCVAIMDDYSNNPYKGIVNSICFTKSPPEDLPTSPSLNSQMSFYKGKIASKGVRTQIIDSPCPFLHSQVSFKGKKYSSV